jgi:hypothetical protein
MPEEVFVNRDLGVIEVRSFGAVSREDLAGSVEQIETLSKETGFSKVLVDISEEEELPNVLDLDDFGGTIPGFLKVAVVAVEGLPTAKKADFLRNVASVKGAQMELFTSRDEALEWLSR